MDLIVEFGYILSKNMPTEFNAVIPNNSKLSQLYNLITAGEVQSDSEAAHAIYNTAKNDKRYLMLKRNLSQKLSDLVFIQNYYETDEENYKTIQFQVEKELIIAEKLLTQNVYHNPTKIIKKVEQSAEKYFLIDTQVAAAKLFRSVYALKGFPNETLEYDAKLKIYSKFQSYVFEACGMWEKLYAKTKYSLAQSQVTFNEASAYAKSIEIWLKEYPSPFLFLYLYRIQIIACYQTNNFSHAMEYNSKLEKLLAEYPYIKSNPLLLEVAYNNAWYYRSNKKLEKALEQINKCLTLSDYRAFDRFLIQELHWDIYLKQNDYKSANKILCEVKSVPQYEFLDPHDKSGWAVREAFMQFLHKKLGLNHEQCFCPEHESTTDAFLKRTKKSAKDKLGYNVNLLIIRLLMQKANQKNNIDKKGNNLRIYFHRYLKDLPGERTTAFFKSLSKVATMEFDHQESQQIIEEQINYLTQENSQTYDLLEWVPYNTLWEIIKK